MIIFYKLDNLIDLLHELDYYKLNPLPTATEYLLDNFDIILTANNITYHLEFLCEKDETFFRLRYSHLIY